MTPEYRKLGEEDFIFFTAALGGSKVSYDLESLQEASKDETEDLRYLPEVVLFPESIEEVSAVLAYCNEKRIPVTGRGAGTGLSGAALPVCAGVVLSTKRMNRILSIDTDNLQAVVQPGVINQHLQEVLTPLGLYYPPDPSSRGSSFIGGNIAHNAGGPHAVKYGVTGEYVLNLKVVLADGAIVETGANTIKNSTGYNLTRLFVGSEGTLGIIVEAVLRLIPLPSKNVLMLIPFDKPESACRAVSAIFKAGITPSALEFMERDALEWAIAGIPDSGWSLGDEQAHLLVELDGNDESVLLHEASRIAELVQDFGAFEVLFAEDEARKQQLWKLRRGIAEAVKKRSVYKEEDTVVPRARLADLLSGVKEIGRQYGFRSVCYGHAGDGNLHVNILRGDLSDHAWNEELPKAIREIFKLCKALGGTLSGEHGVGFVQRNYLPEVMDKRAIALRLSIKKLFDPNGILNPGKIFPDAV